MTASGLLEAETPGSVGGLATGLNGSLNGCRFQPKHHRPWRRVCRTARSGTTEQNLKRQSTIKRFQRLVELMVSHGGQQSQISDQTLVSPCEHRGEEWWFAVCVWAKVESSLEERRPCNTTQIGT